MNKNICLKLYDYGSAMNMNLLEVLPFLKKIKDNAINRGTITLRQKVPREL